MFRNREFVRRLAMLLCLSLMLGLVPFGLIGQTQYVSAAGESILANGDFEADDLRPLKWNVNAPSMGIAVVTSGVKGNNTNLFNMKNMGKTYLEVDSDWFGVVPKGEYHFSLRALFDDTVEPTAGWDYFFYAWVMWDDPDVGLTGEYIQVKPTNDWKEYSLNVTIPENINAAAVRLYINSGKNLAFYIDDIKLVKTGGPNTPVVQPTQPTTATTPTQAPDTSGDPAIPVYTKPTVPSDYNPPEVTSFPGEHPYLYFNSDELAEMKNLVNDSSKTVYGFSWKGQKDNLVSMAQYYLTETEIRQNSNYGTNVTFELYPHLKDPNDPSYRSMYIQASKASNGTLVESPYLGFGCLLPDTLRGRMETLSLAYALTGNTQFSDLAIRYAYEMSQWKWWGDWNWLSRYTKGGSVADASCAWATQAVAAVYDLCYDQMTSEERKTIETAIIEKGLKPMSNEVDPNSTDNGNMMYIGGMLTGCAAIISRDNYEQIKPYLNLALYCVEVAFDNYAYSGNTEGHYYTSFGLEYFLPGVSHMYRATKLDFLFDHPLMSEMLPYWTVQFAASGNMTHPNYSDASVSSYMKLPMAIINKNVGNGLAGYFMTKAGGLGSAWLNFVYLDPTPVVEEPEDLVAVVDSIGYGSLRTGFASDDMMLTLLANNSQMGHNHWDQNSIQFALGSNWLIQDPGVGSYYYKDREFWQKSGHSTILIDGKAQSVKGSGTMKQIFGSDLYGYIVGSAPFSYGAGVLSKFDRHAIQINHSDKAYYVLIDDLASSQERTYGWQMYNGTRSGFTVDGKQISNEGTLEGKNVTMTVGGQKLFLTFVDDQKLSISDKLYYGKDEKGKFIEGGHTLIASSAAAKTHQFMALISTGSAVTVSETYDTSGALAAMIRYNGSSSDFVFFNRATGSATVGLLTTDAKQASVLGLKGGVITEGFAATEVTALTYDGTLLFQSVKPLNVVADADGWHIETTTMQKVTLNIGDSDCDVYVNGRKAKAEIKDGMASFTIASGTADVTLAEKEDVQPTVPTTDPSAPVDPTDPTDPSETTATTDPSNPADSANPTDATVPAGTAEPTDPAVGDGGNQSNATVIIVVIAALVLLAAAGVLLYIFRDKIFRRK